MHQRWSGENVTKMSSRSTISLLLLLNTVAPLISNGSASSLKYSQPMNGDDDGFVPMSHTTHDVRRTNARPETLTDLDDSEQRSFSIRLRDLQSFISHLVDDEQMKIENDAISTVGSSNRRALSTNLLFNDQIIERVKRFAERYIFHDAAANALKTSGRVFLFKGLHQWIRNAKNGFYFPLIFNLGFKKLMWPVFIGIQVAKTVLLAMFLPSIIGSIGKMVGKGEARSNCDITWNSINSRIFWKLFQASCPFRASVSRRKQSVISNSKIIRRSMTRPMAWATIIHSNNRHWPQIITVWMCIRCMMQCRRQLRIRCHCTIWARNTATMHSTCPSTRKAEKKCYKANETISKCSTIYRHRRCCSPITVCWRTSCFLLLWFWRCALAMIDFFLLFTAHVHSV